MGSLAMLVGLFPAPFYFRFDAVGREAPPLAWQLGFLLMMGMSVVGLIWIVAAAAVVIALVVLLVRAVARA